MPDIATILAGVGTLASAVNHSVEIIDTTRGWFLSTKKKRLIDDYKANIENLHNTIIHIESTLRRVQAAHRDKELLLFFVGLQGELKELQRASDKVYELSKLGKAKCMSPYTDTRTAFWGAMDQFVTDISKAHDGHADGGRLHKIMTNEYQFPNNNEFGALKHASVVFSQELAKLNSCVKEGYKEGARVYKTTDNPVRTFEDRYSLLKQTSTDVRTAANELVKPCGSLVTIVLTEAMDKLTRN